MHPKRPRAAGGSSKQPPAPPEIVWDRNTAILQVAAGRSLKSALLRIREELAGWVVVVRTTKERDDVYYYAFRSSELDRLAKVDPERLNWPLELALELHEWQSSRTARGGRVLGPIVAHSDPTSARIVEFDAAGQVIAIGEGVDLTDDSGDGATTAEADDPTWIDLGPTRGSATPPGASRGGVRKRVVRTRGGRRPGGARSPSSEIKVTLSAETAAEIDVGATALVTFQIELTSEAAPLAVSQRTAARPDEPITVSLSANDDAVEIARSHRCTVDPPAPKQPRNGFFIVKGLRPSVVRLAVAFRQGGTELGVIALALEVVDAGAGSARAQGSTAAAPRDVADDDKLLLTVKKIQDGGRIYYDYFLACERLSLLHGPRSKPLLDRGGGPAVAELAFIERIYDRVTGELTSRDDIKQLQRETRALGANLCRELFDPEVAKLLWPLRDRISVIQVVSWEPYIPWELVRLQDPVSDDIDDRFLAEYGLVRTLPDDQPVRSLPMASWAYLGAAYPMGSYPEVGAELDYFTGTSPDSLRGRGIKPKSIDTTLDAFYDALRMSEFDILHISCHAESRHDSIDRASLIIGDEMPPGGSRAQLVEVDTFTVRAEARLKRRRPLIFLNGCETGRIGAVLTAWGGWPNVFLRAGAGAFVGSAWAVRDKPAATFSKTFYNALLDGKTLSEAAGTARAEAKKLGDASWLAFKVYGHPRARCEAA